MSANPEPTFEVLDETECRRLLELHHFGRLAYLDEGDPVIVPVNYRVVDGDVVIRTAPGTKLTQSPMTAVAFEIDGADPLAQWGWSVVVRGRAYDVTDTVDERSERIRRVELRPWAPGERHHWLRIDPTKVTGRRFRVGSGDRDDEDGLRG